jgi:addiction module HigA family antidote
MTRMHNPPHPGEVIREYLGEVTITDAARALGVSRTTLQRVVNGAADVSADMAYRLAAAFNTSAELWAGMQMQYDLHRAEKIKRPRIGRLLAA